MSASTPTSTGPGSQASLNPQAVQFCNQLISNPTLQNAFYQTLDNALTNQQFSDQIFDNFFNQQGFQGCTLEEVIAAQSQIAAYNLFYWQAVYQLSGSVPSGATQLTINLSASNEVQVALGSTYILDYTFQNLVLSWDSGVNASSGQLIFNAQPVSGGTLAMSFDGVIDSASVSGTQETSDSSSSSDSSASSSGGTASTIGSLIQTVGQFMVISTIAEKLKEGASAVGSKMLTWAKQAGSSMQTSIKNLMSEPAGEIETITQAAGAAEGTPGVAATEIAAEPVEDSAMTNETEIEPETVSANTAGDSATTAVEETTEAASETAAEEAGEAVSEGSSVATDVIDGVEDVAEFL